MLAAIQTSFEDMLTLDGIGNALAGGAGVGLTAFPERYAETQFRGLFGYNSGPGSLTLTQWGLRILLMLAEGVAGMAIAAGEGPIGTAGEGITYAAGWHMIRLTYTQFVGATLFGVPV